jgi:outer membrane protein OmpA-like peptidoglycan-associated protein
MRRLLAMAGVAALVLGFGTAALAQQLPHDDPTISGTTGLFVIPRASTLEQGTWSIGGYYGEEVREEDARIRTFGIMGAYGLTDRLEATVSFQPSVKIERDYRSFQAILIRDPYACCTGINDHPFAGGRMLNPSGLIDIRGEEFSGVGNLDVGLKYKFAGDPYEYDGMAVQGWIQAPTSDASGGIGTGSFGLGGKLIGSLEAFEAIGWNAYVGYRWWDTPDPSSKLDHTPRVERFFVSPEFLYGVGFQFPSRAVLQVIGEWIGSVTTRDVTAAYTGGDDISLLQLGVRATLDNGLALGVAANYNFTQRLRARELQANPEELDLEHFGYLITASYSTSRKQPLMYMGTEPMAVPMINAAPTLTCRAERTSIRQGESVRLMATASDPDGDPLTVTWSASAGSLSSTTGTEVTWSSRDVPAGQGPIRARVSDGYGGAADCELRVTVEVPPPPSEPTVLDFTLDDFRSGSARIDNRHKAILDDVALQLRQNPSATAVITGYTDATGNDSINMPLAQERADNAKAYLVETHGIDPSRIMTGAEGSMDPVGDNSTNAGRASNRRVVIVVTIPPR